MYYLLTYFFCANHMWYTYHCHTEAVSQVVSTPVRYAGFSGIKYRPGIG
jgi:hypothetical protein